MTNQDSIAIERFAASLYADHIIKQRVSMAAATRKQTPLPTWTEAGTALRNIWRKNAMQLIKEQQDNFAELVK